MSTNIKQVTVSTETINWGREGTSYELISIQIPTILLMEVGATAMTREVKPETAITFLKKVLLVLEEIERQQKQGYEQNEKS